MRLIFYYPRYALRGLLLFLLAWGHNVPHSWAQAPLFGPAFGVGTYSGTAASSQVSATTVDAFGYVYVTGTFAGTVSFGSFTLSTGGTNNQDVFVAKLDGSGNYLWVAQGGGIAQDLSGSVAVDANGAIYVTGSLYSPTATFGSYTATVTPSGYSTFSSSDIFVARLDANGNWLWVSTAGGTNNDGAGPMAVDPAGNIYITGGFASTTATFGTTTLVNSPNNAGVYELLVAKIDPQGTWVWARSGGGGGQDGGYAIAVDGASNVYLTGLVQSTLGQFGPFSLPADRWSADDVLVAKLDGNGTWLWAVRAGGLSIDEGNGIAVDASGNTYVTGHFSGASATFGPFTLTNGGPLYGYGGTNEIFVAKLNPAGVWQWATRAGGDSNDYGKAIALDATGRLQVVGSFTSAAVPFVPSTLANTSQGVLTSGQMLYPADVFLGYMSTSGTWLGAVGSQGLGNEFVYSLAVDATGNASIAGAVQSATTTFGTTALPGNTAMPTGYVTVVPSTPPLLRVSSLAPSSGTPGQTVTLTGSGFVGVTQVLFHGTPATSFAVQSSTHLTAVVPVGVTAGTVSVQTGSGSQSSATIFQPAVLATAGSVPATLFQAWPNPVRTSEPLHLHLDMSPSAAALIRVELRNVLGQLVRSKTSGEQSDILDVNGLPIGVYQLALLRAGQPVGFQRVALVE